MPNKSTFLPYKTTFMNDVKTLSKIHPDYIQDSTSFHCVVRVDKESLLEDGFYSTEHWNALRNELIDRKDTDFICETDECLYVGIDGGGAYDYISHYWFDLQKDLSTVDQEVW